MKTTLALFILLWISEGTVIGEDVSLILPNLLGKFFIDTNGASIEKKGTIILKPGEKLWYKANDETDEGLIYLGRLLSLRALIFFDCDRITDAGLVHLGQLSSLEKLSLSNCDSITDAGIINVGRISSLKELNLSRCGRITDAGLVHIERLSSLESLDLSCTQITDVGLSTHITKLTSLKELNLCGCPRITNKGVSFLKNLSSLMLLTLSDDSSIDLEIIRELQKVLHGLIVIDIINGESFYIYKGKVKKYRGGVIPQEDEK